MSSLPSFSRRDALKLSLAALSLPALAQSFAQGAEKSSAKPLPERVNPHVVKLKLGVAGYTLRDLTVEAAIVALQQLDVDSFSLFKTHVPIEEGTVEQCREGANKFYDAGIKLGSTGVVNLPNNEAKVRQAFNNAKAAKLKMITCKPSPDAFPLIDKLVKEYDLTLAIHNHGPEDKVYPSPFDALKAVEAYDKRIGLCFDVGHAMRAGVDVVASISKCQARLYDVHLKDSLAVAGTVKDIPVEAGRGNIDLRGVCAALIAINFKGVAGYEYERIAVNPITGLAESIGYVRGLLATMA